MINDKGFTLIEVITAIFLITVGVVGAFSVVQKVAGFISVSSLQLTAVYLAQEGIEITRNIRDTNCLNDLSWDQGITCVPLPCDCEAAYTNTQLDSSFDRFLKFNNGFYGYSGTTETRFKRKITISDCSPPNTNCLNVSVLVEWEERGKSHELSVQEELYNWRQ